MSLHKLTAGSGYDYLTRQVAALGRDRQGAHRAGRRTTPNGASRPGCGSVPAWTGIDGLDVGDPVTAEQMRALFGCGLHPLAEMRLQQLEGPDLTGQDFRDVDAVGGTVQDHRRCDAVPGRGGQADRCSQRRDRGAGRRLGRGG